MIDQMPPMMSAARSSLLHWNSAQYSPLINPCSSGPTSSCWRVDMLRGPRVSTAIGSGALTTNVLYFSHRRTEWCKIQQWGMCQLCFWKTINRYAMWRVNDHPVCAAWLFMCGEWSSSWGKASSDQVVDGMVLPGRPAWRSFANKTVEPMRVN